MKPEPRLCRRCRTSRGWLRYVPKNSVAKSSNGSRICRRTTRSALMLTTAGITFATARTTGSEAGSVGVDDGHGVGVCAKSRALLANSTAIAVLDAWRQTLGSARVSPSRAFLLHTRNRKDCFGETPKLARETRALPGILAFDIVVYCIPSGRVKLPAQVTGRPFHCQLAGRLVFTTLS